MDRNPREMPYLLHPLFLSMNPVIEHWQLNTGILLADKVSYDSDDDDYCEDGRNLVIPSFELFFVKVFHVSRC